MLPMVKRPKTGHMRKFFKTLIAGKSNQSVKKPVASNSLDNNGQAAEMPDSTSQIPSTSTKTIINCSSNYISEDERSLRNDMRPSLRGATLWGVKKNCRITGIVKYRRELKLYKALVGMLIEAKFENMWKTIAQKSFQIVKKHYKLQTSRKYLSAGPHDQHSRHGFWTENVDPAAYRNQENKIEGFTENLGHDQSELAAAGNSKTAVQSKDDNFCHRTNKNEHAIKRAVNSFAEGIDLTLKEFGEETQIEGSNPDPYEFDPMLNSMQDRDKIRDKKLTTSTVAKTSKLVKKNDSRPKIEVIDVKQIPTISTNRENLISSFESEDREFSKKTNKKRELTGQGTKSGSNEIGENNDNISKKSGKKFSVYKLKNSKESKLNVETKRGYHTCSCTDNRSKVRQASKGIKISSYSIPESIVHPCLNTKKGFGNRSTPEKTGLDKIGGNESLASLIVRKEPEKFYSRLECSEVVKLKSDPNKDVHNQTLIIDTAEVEPQKKMKKSVQLIPSSHMIKNVKPLKKFSIANFTLPEKEITNNDDQIKATTKRKSISERSAKSKLPITLSKYSIPISIEVDYSTRRDSHAGVFLGNLIQSKITRYFPVSKPPQPATNNCLQPEKKTLTIITDNHLQQDRAEENGNKIERGNNAGLSKNQLQFAAPIIQSDIFLSSWERLNFMKDDHATRKQMVNNLRVITRDEYLYGKLNSNRRQHRKRSMKMSSLIANRGLSLRDNNIDITEDNFNPCTQQSIIEDSNVSELTEVIPSSYSIFSYNVENNNTADNETNCDLDSQQKKELLAPWDTLDIYEKVTRWHDDTFEP